MNFWAPPLREARKTVDSHCRPPAKRPHSKSTPWPPPAAPETCNAATDTRNIHIYSLLHSSTCSPRAPSWSRKPRIFADRGLMDPSTEIVEWKWEGSSSGSRSRLGRPWQRNVQSSPGSKGTGPSSGGTHFACTFCRC